MSLIISGVAWKLPPRAGFPESTGGLGISEILATRNYGVGPLASAKTARWMRSSVPGVHIPDAIVERIEQAGTPKEQKAVGKRLCVELIQEIREIPGVHGVHLMAYRQEEFVSEIIQASGVLQGRSRRARAPAATGGAGT